MSFPTTLDNLSTAYTETESQATVHTQAHIDLANAINALETAVGTATSITTIRLFYNVKDSGAVGNGVADDSTAIQAAINAQQVNGGVVYFPPGTYLCNSNLVVAKGVGGAWTNSTRPLHIRGSGIDATTLLAGGQFSASGIIGYGSGGVNPLVAQVICSDLTLDGNYSGAGGTIAQPGSGAGALVALPWPGTSGGAPARNGRYHTWQRVRFYRPTGYGFQGTQGHHLSGCVFDTCGQPAAGVHYDNLGSGSADAIVIGCTWLNSSGNYADFVAAAGGIRLIMIACESFNHGVGGVYGCGNGSIIANNNLDATSGGIGYDAGTTVGQRAANIVTGNRAPNMTVLASGLSPTSYGDIVYGNSTSDQGSFGSFDVQGVLKPAAGFVLGTGNPGAGPGAHSDGTNLYFETNGAGNVFFRPGGSGSDAGRVDIAGGGIGIHDPAGTIRSTIYSVSGVPGAGVGANGDFCLRSDTPGTANQRLYVKSAGAWVGIL